MGLKFNKKLPYSARFNMIYWQCSRGLLFWPTLYVFSYMYRRTNQMTEMQMQYAAES